MPGEFGAFTILAGQLPNSSFITFKALQKYADGSVVRWIETAAPGSSNEPEHPAPVLQLAVLEGGPKVTAIPPKAAAAPSSGPKVTAIRPKAAAAPSNTGPVVLSILALVLAAAALGVGVVSRARSKT